MRLQISVGYAGLRHPGRGLYPLSPEPEVSWACASSILALRAGPLSPKRELGMRGRTPGPPRLGWSLLDLGRGLWGMGPASTPLWEGRGRGAGPRVARGGQAAGLAAAQSGSSKPQDGVPTGTDPEPPEEDLDAVQQWTARSARLPARW